MMEGIPVIIAAIESPLWEAVPLPVEGGSCSLGNATSRPEVYICEVF